MGLRLNWVYHGALGEGLQPGATQGGFGFASNDLPGISPAELEGDTDSPRFQDEGPDGDIAEQLNELEQHDHVLRNVAAPKIAVPAPFDRAELLRRIQAEVKTWVDRKLLDAALYAQLDHWFQAAIAAAARGDRAGCANHVGSLRARLLAEYPDLDAGDGGVSGGPQHAIDRLAARVLAFDLGYALRR